MNVTPLDGNVTRLTAPLSYYLPRLHPVNNVSTSQDVGYKRARQHMPISLSLFRLARVRAM